MKTRQMVVIPVPAVAMAATGAHETMAGKKAGKEKLSPIDFP